MAEEDFDIDFYGDEQDGSGEQQQQQTGEQQDHDNHDGGREYPDGAHGDDGDDRMEEHRHEDDRPHHDVHDHEAAEPTSRQGTKRKSEEDDRPIDAGATAAVMISELNWWTTDDDIRGWLRRAACENEVKELTFSEHKVNGKSKGQAYVEFYSPQASTAAKHYIDQLSADGGQLGQKKIATQYWNPGVNPFRTLPKDAPARVKEQPRAAPSGPYNDRGGFGGGYRGRGGFRGGMNQNNYNRNFNNNAGGMGYNNNMGGGGYNNPMGGGGGNFGGFNGRGGMMGGGMRGGPGGMRGGRGGNMMGMNPMGNNPMGNMPMGMPGNMGMGMMGPGGMPGFQGMPPNFGGGFGFGQQQGGGGGGGDWGNPHGAKRPRPE